jgi:hypothetical protein
VDRRRGNHHAAFCTKIDAIRQTGPVVQRSSGQSKIEMQAAAAGLRRYRLGELAVDLLEPAQALISAMTGIDVENGEARNAPGYNGDIHLGPASKPICDFLFASQPVLVGLPANHWQLRPRADWDD